MGFLGDPFAVPFMAKALVAMLLLSVLGALLGPFVVTRGLEFLTDALTHTVLPGVVTGFVLAGVSGVFWGALVAASVTAVAVTLLSHARRVRQDAAIAVLLSTLFAIGVVLLSRRNDYAGDLTNFLTGQSLTLSATDVRTVLVATVLVVLGLLFAGYLLYQRAFDSEFVRARGQSVFCADLLLNAMIAVTVVCAVRTVGTLMALSVLVIPGLIGANASRRWAGMICLGGLGFAVACWLGLIFSYQASVTVDLALPPSAPIVLTGCVFVGLAAIPRRVRAWRRTHVA